MGFSFSAAFSRCSAWRSRLIVAWSFCANRPVSIGGAGGAFLPGCWPSPWAPNRSPDGGASLSWTCGWRPNNPTSRSAIALSSAASRSAAAASWARKSSSVCGRRTNSDGFISARIWPINSELDDQLSKAALAWRSSSTRRRTATGSLTLMPSFSASSGFLDAPVITLRRCWISRCLRAAILAISSASFMADSSNPNISVVVWRSPAKVLTACMRLTADDMLLPSCIALIPTAWRLASPGAFREMR